MQTPGWYEQWAEALQRVMDTATAPGWREARHAWLEEGRGRVSSGLTLASSTFVGTAVELFSSAATVWDREFTGTLGKAWRC
jgi:hypothetical protein